MPPAAASSIQIARQSRSNLAFALVCLPRERKRDMITFYAFCRMVDDIADDENLTVDERKQRLEQWSKAVLAGDGWRHPVLAETLPLAAKYSFDTTLLAEIIDGVSSDLTRNRYESIDELLGYCYKVASVVGLVSIKIFGHQNSACRDYAIHLGYALQLTNILRDVGQDARELGRIYLPLEDLRQFGLGESDILESRYDERFVALMEFEYQRARHFYDLAAAELPAEDRQSMIAAEMMGQVYREILEKLRRHRFRVFDRRLRLNPIRKGLILGGYLLKRILRIV